MIADHPKLFLDLEPDSDSMLEDVLAGLAGPEKSLPSKYFYDERGSLLFDQICDLEEYYLTRTELTILNESRDEMIRVMGESVILIEYGSGSSMKTRSLLDSIPHTEAYVPIDISREHLIRTSEELRSLFPHINVLPVCADYSQVLNLDLDTSSGSRLSVFFPGSTIGNFTREHAVWFLKRVHRMVGEEGGILIGVDLIKSHSLLNAAYNDSEGITAAFNLNILNHINQKLGTSIDLAQFNHKAYYNSQERRVEMHLESKTDQSFLVGDTRIMLRAGERIRTEYSHKYSLGQFADMASEANFEVEKVWTDSAELFSVQYLKPM